MYAPSLRTLVISMLSPCFIIGEISINALRNCVLSLILSFTLHILSVGSLPPIPLTRMGRNPSFSRQIISAPNSVKSLGFQVNVDEDAKVVIVEGLNGKVPVTEGDYNPINRSIQFLYFILFNRHDIIPFIFYLS